MKVCYTKKNHIEFYVDDEDYEEVLKHTWCATTEGYIVTSINCKQIRIHRFLLNTPIGMVTDHKDGNPRNNCRDNIRICTHAENCHNCKAGSGSRSKYKGVDWMARDKRWRAYIQSDRVRTYLGTFKTEIEAAKAYNEAAILLHGEFARLNEVD